MGTGRILQYFGDEIAPSTNPPGAVSSADSSATAPTNGAKVARRWRPFDPTTDQTMQLNYLLPSNYSSGGSITFEWSVGTNTGNVVWKYAYCLIHKSGEGSPTVITSTVFGTVGTTTVAAAATNDLAKATTIDLGVTGAHAGDTLAVMLGRDADNAADTINAFSIAFIEPWLFTYTTV